MWGSPVSDGRGLMSEDLIDKYDAAVLNTGQATYQHHSGSVSHLDVAIVDNATAAVSQWSVLICHTVTLDFPPWFYHCQAWLLLQCCCCMCYSIMQ